MLQSGCSSNRAQNCFDGRVGQLAHLVVSAVLDGMRHEDPFRTRKAERLRLRLGRIFEHARSDEYRRNATRF